MMEPLQGQSPPTKGDEGGDDLNSESGTEPLHSGAEFEHLTQSEGEEEGESEPAKRAVATS